MSVPPTFTKELLSASTNGRPIAVAAVATPGTNIHTDGNAPNEMSEVWLYASNVGAVDRLLTIELGGTGVANEQKYAVPAQQTVQILIGHPINGGVSIAAYADAGGEVNVAGWINHIDQTP